MNTIVLGIGNRLMKDDGIGIYVVEELINSYKKDDINYIVGETDIEYCLDVISTADRLVIIDSIYSKNINGAIYVLPLQDKNSNYNGELSLHNVNLIDIIRQYFQDMKGIIVGIEAAEIDYGIGLSTKLKRNFYKIVPKVNEIISCLYMI